MRILLFGVTELGTYILKNILAIPHYEVCGLVFNHSNNFDIQEMKTLARRRQIDFFEATNTKDSAFHAWVADKQPDVLVIATFDYLVPKSVYTLAKIGAVNIHPSYLPYYRGYHPYFWPIANGEKETGVSIHYLTEGFDDGDIVGQEKVVISLEDTSGTVLQKQKPIAWKILEKYLATAHQTGKSPAGTPQPIGEFIIAPKVKVEDTIIKWPWVTSKIVDRVRALNPHAPAYTFFRGEVIGLYQVTPTKSKIDGAPGTVLELTERGPVVKTGDGAVILEIVMFSRSYLLTGHDFQRRENIQLKEAFL
jgi:methionyl-tRNA formyltransferase